MYEKMSLIALLIQLFKLNKMKMTKSCLISLYCYFYDADFLCNLWFHPKKKKLNKIRI